MEDPKPTFQFEHGNSNQNQNQNLPRRRKIFEDDSDILKSRPDNFILNSLPTQDRKDLQAKGEPGQISKTNNFWNQMENSTNTKNITQNNKNVDLLDMDLGTGESITNSTNNTKNNRGAPQPQNQNLENYNIFEAFDMNSNNNTQNQKSFHQNQNFNNSNPFEDNNSNNEVQELSPFEQKKQFFQQSQQQGSLYTQNNPNQQGQFWNSGIQNF